MKYFIPIVNFILLIYFSLSIINSYTDFVSLEGTILSAKRSGNRIPYYSFKLKEFDCIFQNKANSFLSLLNNNKYVYEKINKQRNKDKTDLYLFGNKSPESETSLTTNKVVFYINKNDQNKLTENQNVFFAGLRFINQPEKPYIKIIDSYHYTIQNGKSVIYIVLFFSFSTLLLFFNNYSLTQSRGFNLIKLLFFTDFAIFLLLMIL